MLLTAAPEFLFSLDLSSCPVLVHYLVLSELRTFDNLKSMQVTVYGSTPWEGLLEEVREKEDYWGVKRMDVCCIYTYEDSIMSSSKYCWRKGNIEI
jgi:hypothetical protein